MKWYEKITTSGMLVSKEIDHEKVNKYLSSTSIDIYSSYEEIKKYAEASTIGNLTYENILLKILYIICDLKSHEKSISPEQRNRYKIKYLIAKDKSKFNLLSPEAELRNTTTQNLSDTIIKKWDEMMDKDDLIYMKIEMFRVKIKYGINFN